MNLFTMFDAFLSRTMTLRSEREREKMKSSNVFEMCFVANEQDGKVKD